MRKKAASRSRSAASASAISAQNVVSGCSGIVSSPDSSRKTSSARARLVTSTVNGLSSDTPLGQFSSNFAMDSAMSGSARPAFISPYMSHAEDAVSCSSSTFTTEMSSFPPSLVMRGPRSGGHTSGSSSPAAMSWKKRRPGSYQGLQATERTSDPTPSSGRPLWKWTSPAKRWATQ